MRLSDRLKKIYSCIQDGESVADIGTDHGYVPLLLYENKISPKVVMSDISEGSLAKAADNFRLHDIELPGELFRTGNGLKKINYGEVDAVIIAGLGGKTIIDILDAEPKKTSSFKKLVLQPRNACGELRYYLAERGFAITDEILAEEGKFICEIIVAVPPAGRDTDSSALLPRHDDIRWKYPAELIGNPLYNKHVAIKIKSLEKQIENLRLSKEDKSEQIKEVKADIDYLTQILRYKYRSD